MGHKPPWKDIPDTNLVPADAYAFTVKEMTETMSKQKEDAKPKLMYVVVLKIDEPKAFKGIQLYDRFTIGTEDDPNAEDPETWKGSFAARRMKQFVKSLSINMGDDMDDTMEAAEGQKAIAMVSLDPKRKDPKTGVTYNESNSISAYYAMGTPNITVGGSKPTATNSGAAPASPVKAKPKTTEAAPATSTTEQVKPKKVTKAEVTTCPICGDENVPRLEFIAHVNAHGSEEEATE